MNLGIIDEMYREHILDLYKNPRNKGLLENTTIAEKCFNPACGDEVTIQALIENNKVKLMSFCKSYI